MEGVSRHAQNTRRMEAGRSGSICRHFINGSCRYGPRCNYRHEWPVLPSARICRHFQKGVCWYGERCRFLHVVQPVADSIIAGRRGSMPTVPSYRLAQAQPERRGSEPTLLQTEVMSSRECGRPGMLVHISNPRPTIGHLVLDITEEQSQAADSSVTASLEQVQTPDAAQTTACDQASSTETTEAGATAAASGTRVEVKDMDAFLQSKDVTCGICMDKVYEKRELGDQVFGILPNCNHAYCLHCIVTWRKTKAFGADVVKSCPQCRVVSAFYVPNKYWVEGPAKEGVIAAFKEKCSKKSCSYYARYRCCPFKSGCLYRHKPTRHRPSQYLMVDDDYYEDLVHFFLAMTLLGGDDDDYDDDDYA